jgi:hypothetical protein
MIGKDARALGHDDPSHLSDDDRDWMEEKYDEERERHDIEDDFSEADIYSLDDVDEQIGNLSRDASVESFESLEAEHVTFHYVADAVEAYEDGGGPEVDAREQKV